MEWGVLFVDRYQVLAGVQTRDRRRRPASTLEFWGPIPKDGWQDLTAWFGHIRHRIDSSKFVRLVARIRKRGTISTKGVFTVFIRAGTVIFVLVVVIIFLIVR